MERHCDCVIDPPRRACVSVQCCGTVVALGYCFVWRTPCLGGGGGSFQQLGTPRGGGVPHTPPPRPNDSAKFFSGAFGQ